MTQQLKMLQHKQSSRSTESDKPQQIIENYQLKGSEISKNCKRKRDGNLFISEFADNSSTTLSTTFNQSNILSLPDLKRSKLSENQEIIQTNTTATLSNQSHTFDNAANETQFLNNETSWSNSLDGTKNSKRKRDEYIEDCSDSSSLSGSSILSNTSNISNTSKTEMLAALKRRRLMGSQKSVDNSPFSSQSNLESPASTSSSSNNNPANISISSAATVLSKKSSNSSSNVSETSSCTFTGMLDIIPPFATHSVKSKRLQDQYMQKILTVDNSSKKMELALPLEQSVEEDEEDEEEEISGPQMKLVNGYFVLVDENGDFVNKNDVTDNIPEVEDEKTDEIEEKIEIPEALLRRKRKKSNRMEPVWKTQDTQLLLQGLAVFGTNFTKIEKLFPNREPRDVRARFKKMDGESRSKVNKHLKMYYDKESEHFKQLPVFQEAMKAIELESVHLDELERQRAERLIEKEKEDLEKSQKKPKKKKEDKAKEKTFVAHEEKPIITELSDEE